MASSNLKLIVALLAIGALAPAAIAAPVPSTNDLISPGAPVEPIEGHGEERRNMRMPGWYETKVDPGSVSISGQEHWGPGHTGKRYQIPGATPVHGASIKPYGKERRNMWMPGWYETKVDSGSVSIKGQEHWGPGHTGKRHQISGETPPPCAPATPLPPSQMTSPSQVATESRTAPRTVLDGPDVGEGARFWEKVVPWTACSG
ncbi:hypothetical protein PG984_016270 [Apiospora sp. TS-2023a]